MLVDLDQHPIIHARLHAQVLGVEILLACGWFGSDNCVLLPLLHLEAHLCLCESRHTGEQRQKEGLVAPVLSRVAEMDSAPVSTQ